MTRPGRRKLTDIKTVPFQGGAITVREPALLPFGAFSMVQNLDNKHPGLVSRAGCRKLHATADGTNKVLSLYQFNKSEVSESHFYAQMADGDVHEADTAPPGVDAAAFQTTGEAHDGTAAGLIPAAWSNIRDMLVYSNGSDQHQIYGGSSSYVEKCVVYKSTTALATGVLVEGEDYSYKVRNAIATDLAVLTGMGTNGTDRLLIKTPVPVKSFNITVVSANTTAATMTLEYHNADGTWDAVSGLSDGTATTNGKAFGDTGAGVVAFTAPTDIMPSYLYGACGFWYAIDPNAAMSAATTISSITYDSDFQDVVNVWDGVPQNAVEIYVEGTSQWETYGPGAVTLSELAAGKKIIVLSADPIEAIYWDVQGTPNADGTSVTSLKYWDGDSFETVGTTTDGSDGLSNTGWMSFPRQSAAQPRQFETSSYYAYAYELILDAKLAADMVVQVQVRPYFDIDEAGQSNCNCAWKEMMLYTFDQYSEYIYVSAPGRPLVLNGSQYGILVAGDGRANAVKAMRAFHNEVVVAQEEKGKEGGCITLFEGYSPTTFGKLILSTRIGIMNSKCMEVVDGVLTSTATNEQIKTLVFGISRYGVWASDGRVVSIISDDIQNYFDPGESECVRLGYEAEHWLAYDSKRNVLRLGIVSGSSATVPNIFPVFDLQSKTWSFDKLGQALSCMTEVGAQSGNVPVIQVGGGTADGTVYQLNYGTADVATAIDSYATMEFPARGEYVDMEVLLLRCKTQAAGDITVTLYENAVSQGTMTLSMIAENTSQTIRRHRRRLGLVGQHIALKIDQPTKDIEMYLEDIGAAISAWTNR